MQKPKGKFNKIKELSDKDIFDGVKYCFENSEELFKSTLILKRNKKFGVAYSILILSVEELIKSISLLNILISGPNEIEISREIFESKNLHISKHNFALFINEYFKSINLKKIMKADLDLENPNEFSKKIFAELNFEKIFEKVDAEKNRINNWFNEANKKKNVGLYVDFNDSWQTPKVIDEIQLLEAIEETKNIRKNIYPLFEVLMILNNEQIEINIKIIRKMIEDFVEMDKNTTANSGFARLRNM